MPQSYNETAEKLMSQLNEDTASLDWKNGTLNDWQDPIPFETVTVTPPFPIHCLPDTLRVFAQAVAEHTQAVVLLERIQVDLIQSVFFKEILFYLYLLFYFLVYLCPKSSCKYCLYTLLDNHQ